MILTIDIGNTKTAFGLGTEDHMEPCYRVATDRWKTADDHWVTFSTLLEGEPAPEDVIISSVVPSVEREIVQMCERWMDLPATVVDPVEMEIMPLDVDIPREVGADRVVNCYGAVRLFGAPAVVVDFGTATTFDVISEDGTYRGGMILPGPGIAAEALFEKTALLPKVDFRRPTGLIGKNTVGSIRSGLYYGLLSQVEGIIERIREEVDSEIRVIATGGVSRVLARECAVVDAFEPLLTLKGLAFIYRDYVQAEE